MRQLTNDQWTAIMEHENYKRAFDLMREEGVIQALEDRLAVPLAEFAPHAELTDAVLVRCVVYVASTLYSQGQRALVGATQDELAAARADGARDAQANLDRALFAERELDRYRSIVDVLLDHVQTLDKACGA